MHDQPNVDERLWRRVDRSNANGCWPYTGPRHPKGYGQFSDDDLRNRPAHRVAWRLTFGPIPAGMLVCHACDNPPCCNPSHLFLGTYADNVRDMIEKGRQSGAKRNRTRSFLTDDKVRAIRAFAAGGVTPQHLAAHYGVSRAHVAAIAAGHSRKNVT